MQPEYIGLIFASAAIAVVWAIINAFQITSIKIDGKSLLSDEENEGEEPLINVNRLELITEIGNLIKNGANSFLFREYTIMAIFIVIFSIIIILVVDIYGQEKAAFRAYATIAFIVGSLTSMLCGWIGMRIAVATNFRTSYCAMTSMESAFTVAYRGGCVMGFASVGLALGILMALLLVYIAVNNPQTQEDYAVLMELVAGYGLGGSSMALFGRVGGGIYTKAADVGGDLVGKVESGLDEDDPRNPAVVADLVGDNVGDIAGMGSDLFGSFAESTCSALVLIASTKGIISPDNKVDAGMLAFPLMISAAGIIGCLLTSIFGIYLYKVKEESSIQKSLNLQLIISTIFTLLLMIPTIYILPEKWTFMLGAKEKSANRWYAFVSPALGCVSGLLIGMSTDYYTSYAYSPVKAMSKACSSGPAINVIYGLALGYLSTIIPVILIAITILVSISLLGMLGVALSAIGMLSTLAVGLAIDAYGPISDNAGGISEMSHLGPEIRKITDALDAAGNTTAAVGKGFAIGSAALVSLALYGAFVTRARNGGNRNPILSIEVTDPWIFCTLLIGAMLPFAFSALTMKSVGFAADQMVKEVRRQIQEDNIIEDKNKKPDYKKCIEVSTNASLKEMILPGLLVIITPLFFGILFHPALVAGILPGALLSGVQMAISMSNTGGAWDNCKKLIESGDYVNAQGVAKGKNSDEHKAAVIGDTIGDPLKDTSGPSLNILIKLMAIISLVFAGGFDHTSWLAKPLGIQRP